MTEDKVYRPEVIDSAPFPNQSPGESFNTTPEKGSGQIATQKINNQSFPEKRIAVELISSALNTKSRKVLGTFQLTQSGGFQIGDYTQGESGQLDITPNGISMKDIAGVLTLVMDALTGDITMKGTLQAGSIIGKEVIVGNNTIILDGDAEHPKIVLYNNGIPEILIGEP